VIGERKGYAAGVMGPMLGVDSEPLFEVGYAAVAWDVCY